MEAQVKETVYCLYGINEVLDSLDQDIVRPLSHLRYNNGGSNSSPPAKMIFITGAQGCGHRSVCSALVNELRRGKSNKRGDVHYNNRDVKYLEWNFRNNDPLELRRIFATAKENEFTVLAIHRFEVIFPRAATAMTETLGQLLDETEPGKILVVAISSRENDCNEEMLEKMNYKYHLPLPDADARQEIIFGLLDDENAELSPDSLINTIIHATSYGYTTEHLLQVVHSALRQARVRRRSRPQEDGQGEDVLKVTAVDFSYYLDLGDGVVRGTPRVREREAWFGQMREPPAVGLGPRDEEDDEDEIRMENANGNEDDEVVFLRALPRRFGLGPAVLVPRIEIEMEGGEADDEDEEAELDDNDVAAEVGGGQEQHDVDDEFDEEMLDEIDDDSDDDDEEIDDLGFGPN